MFIIVRLYCNWRNKQNENEKVFFNGRQKYKKQRKKLLALELLLINVVCKSAEIGGIHSSVSVNNILLYFADFIPFSTCQMLNIQLN